VGKGTHRAALRETGARFRVDVLSVATVTANEEERAFTALWHHLPLTAIRVLGGGAPFWVRVVQEVGQSLGWPRSERGSRCAVCVCVCVCVCAAV
jgi:hypothetical protein